MLYKIIQERILLAGTTQAKVAETIGATPAQFSLYLRGKAALNNESIENCLTALDINVEVYHKRLLFAKEVAEELSNYNLNDSELLTMTKSKMKSLLSKDKGRLLHYLIEVDDFEFKEIVESGIIDYEGTFSFFRILVAHIIQLGEKPTPKVTVKSLSSLLCALPVVGGAFAIAAPISMGLLGASSLGYVAFNIFKKNTFLSPLLSLTYQSLKKK